MHIYIYIYVYVYIYIYTYISIYIHIYQYIHIYIYQYIYIYIYVYMLSKIWVFLNKVCWNGWKVQYHTRKSSVAFCLFRVISGSLHVVPLCSRSFRFSQTTIFHKIFWLTPLLKMSFTLDLITKLGKRFYKVAQFWCNKK